MPAISLRLDEDLLTRLDALTDEETSRSQVARRLLRQALTSGGAYPRQSSSPFGKQKHRGPKSSGSAAPKEEAVLVFEPVGPVTGYSESIDPVLTARTTCDHPPARILAGQCQACGERIS